MKAVPIAQQEGKPTSRAEHAPAPRTRRSLHARGHVAYLQEGRGQPGTEIPSASEASSVWNSMWKICIPPSHHGPLFRGGTKQRAASLSVLSTALTRLGGRLVSRGSRLCRMRTEEVQTGQLKLPWSLLMRRFTVYSAEELLWRGLNGAIWRRNNATA